MIWRSNPCLPLPAGVLLASGLEHQALAGLTHPSHNRWRCMHNCHPPWPPGGRVGTGSWLGRLRPRVFCSAARAAPPAAAGATAPTACSSFAALPAAGGTAQAGISSSATSCPSSPAAAATAGAGAAMGSIPSGVSAPAGEAPALLTAAGVARATSACQVSGGQRECPDAHMGRRLTQLHFSKRPAVELPSSASLLVPAVGATLHAPSCSSSWPPS